MVGATWALTPLAIQIRPAVSPSRLQARHQLTDLSWLPVVAKAAKPEVVPRSAVAAAVLAAVEAGVRVLLQLPVVHRQ